MNALRLDAFLPYRLSVASNLASAVIARGYDRMFGLAVPEWRVIALLAEHGCATQQQLVAWSRMDKMSISRAVRPLVERALIERVVDATDARSRQLSLTAEGQALYARIVPEARRLESALLADLSPEERATLDSVLRRIEQAALQLT